MVAHHIGDKIITYDAASIFMSTDVDACILIAKLKKKINKNKEI